LNRWKRPPRGHGKFGVAAKIERTHRGEVYASKAEAAYAAQLDVRQKAGQLREWKRAPRLPLVVNGLVVGHYRPDFEVTMPDGLVTFVEVKGAWNEADRLRVRLAFACYKSLRLLCVRRRPGGLFENISAPLPADAATASPTSARRAAAAAARPDLRST